MPDKVNPVQESSLPVTAHATTEPDNPERTQDRYRINFLVAAVGLLEQDVRHRWQYGGDRRSAATRS